MKCRWLFCFAAMFWQVVKERKHLIDIVKFHVSVIWSFYCSFPQIVRTHSCKLHHLFIRSFHQLVAALLFLKWKNTTTLWTLYCTSGNNNFPPFSVFPSSKSVVANSAIIGSGNYFF